MTDSGDPTALTASSALQRAQAISRALTDAARRARFSTRARGAYRGDSFEARRGAKFFRVLSIALFVLIVAVPNVTAIVYFGLLASDQYVSEAKFTVSSGLVPKMDEMGSVTGVPPILIVQDTQVVTNYIHSRPMVEELERTVGLRDVYSSPSIDLWARFRKNKPIEKFTDYWEKMSDTSIALPSGIVTLTVRAFSPEEAKRIADAVITLSENLINDLNDRMRRDTVLASERDMKQAAQDLGHARMQMEFERNAEGLIDVDQTNKALSGLVGDLQTTLLAAQQEYDTQIPYVSADAPQMQVLKSRITAMKGQLEQLQAQLTSQNEQSASATADRALSGKMTKFAELDLDERIAEKRYALTVAAVESARVMSERRMLYLHEIVAPALPEESKYPKRWLFTGMTLLASLIGWATAVAAASFVRNHMA
ncbi:MAG TPA: lipopolysaccharide biosynthesis protein [Xanthobacteraceae bacterium]|nr:lipopolysaccharide biosynthesis protein [Xanthobacteraceae bacterium]